MAGRTIAEKIIQDHVIDKKADVEPGNFVRIRVDFAFANDITAPIAIKEFEEIGAKDVFDKNRVGLVPDHFTPAKDIKSASQVKLLREFAKKLNLPWYFEVGRVGIEHTFLAEQGFILPGNVVVGADSHTCTGGALGAFAIGVGSTDFLSAITLGEVWIKVPETIKFVYYGKLGKWTTSKDLILYTIGDIGVDGALYKVMEFTGPVISELSVESRMTMTNMAIEAGGKTGIMEPDEKVVEYIKGRAKFEYKIYKSDPDARYVEVREYDVSKIEPQVSVPFLPSNTRNVSELSHITIDQAFIGSCTNGKYEDLVIAAKILKGRKVNPNVRLIVIPATPEIYLKALKEGIIEIFLEAGASIGPATCGPCLGGHMGILAEGERAISTTNRNFVGRMGHPKSEVYLASPAVVAASAITGRITHPAEIIKD